ncbi:hypothetical protein DIPPA_24326 [Diplonema papillatum]|nr:hypothetical protein DIPPA_24326 [Diplonema papillatum]
MLPMLEKIRLPPRARPFREPSASVSPTDYPRPPRAAAAAPTHVAAPVAQRPAPVVAWNWRRYYATELPSTRKRLRAPEPGAPPAAKRPKLAQNLPPPQGGGGGQPPAGAPTPQPVLVVSPQRGV